MATPRAGAAESFGRGVLRLQQRLVARTANYLNDLGDLVAQGSVEPRAYIDEYFRWWSGGLEEVGDWLRPRDTSTPRDCSMVTTLQLEMRPERGDVGFKVPVEVFDRLGDETTIVLSTNGLLQRFDPAEPLRPVITLAPEQNVRIWPNEVTCATRDAPELKIYGVSSLIRSGQRFEGLVWGAPKTTPAQRFLVAAVDLTIA
jgi:hypothetical protein